MVHPMLRAAHVPPLYRICEHASYELDALERRSISILEASTTSVLRVTKWAAMAARQPLVVDEVGMREFVQPFVDLPIDYSVGTLRARLVRVERRAAWLTLCIHHVVLDCPSQQLVHAHLTSILEAQLSNHPVPRAHDASVLARNAIARYVTTQSLPREPALPSHATLRLPFARPLAEQEADQRSASSSWHVADVTIVAAQSSARRLSVTLNAFLLGTLAWTLRSVSGQQHFAIWQTYLGRGMEELHTVGSFSTTVPMTFDICDGVGLDAVRAITYKQRRARKVFVQTAQRATVAYELNDLRPLPRPVEQKQKAIKVSLVDLFFIVNQFADGYDAVLLYDASKYDVSGAEVCMKSWMSAWMSLGGL